MRPILWLTLFACRNEAAPPDDSPALDSDPPASADTDDTTMPDTDVDPPEPPVVDVVIAVDRSVVLGDVQPLTGVNKAPLLRGRTTGKVFDFTQLYQAFGITDVRLHDGAADLCKVYTDDALTRVSTAAALDADDCGFTPSGPTDAARWSVNDATDVDNAAHYDFTDADETVDTIVDGGFEWMLRLGESYNGPNDADNPAAWGQVARNVYAHYATGWPGTTDVSRAPAWVEIHNEPDGMFWNGTIADFLDVYKETFDRATAVSATGLTRPGFGGSGFTEGGTSTWVAGTGGLVRQFVDAEVPERTEFFSVHHYNDCTTATPHALADYLADVRATLDAAGGGDVPLLLTEWNIGLGNVCGGEIFKTPQAAAYLGAGLALQHEPSLDLQRSYYYSGAPPMSLFEMDETANTFEIAPAAYAMRAHATLEGSLVQTRMCNAAGEACQERIAASGAGEPVHAVVAKTSAGVRAVLTNYGATARTVALKLDASSAMPTTWEVYRADHAGAEVTVSAVAASGRYVPTTASLAAAKAKWAATTVAPVGVYVPISLGPWEVVAVVGR